MIPAALHETLPLPRRGLTPTRLYRISREPTFPSGEAEQLRAVQELAERCQAAVDQMNADLERAGFTPPGTDPHRWARLAHAVQLDPVGRSFREIYEEALVYAERRRVEQRFHQRLNDRFLHGLDGDGPTSESLPDAVRRPSFTFAGSRDWENWGLGIDVGRTWHLFHFGRDHGTWRRHAHAALRIPGGMAHDLAQALVSGAGRLDISKAHTVWKAHANGLTYQARTIDAVKAPLSRLGGAIRDAVGKEGHRPEGAPIAWRRTERCWQAHLRFGHALRREKSGIEFQPAY